MLGRTFESFPIGTVCVCDEQSAGRGRGYVDAQLCTPSQTTQRSDNVWNSPLGSLTFSFSSGTSLYVGTELKERTTDVEFTDSPPHHIPLLQYVTTLAVVKVRP